MSCQKTSGVSKCHLLNEIHDEVDSKRFDEYELHAYDEGMVDLIQDRLLKMQVLQRVMLKYNVLADALHGIELLCMFVLYEIYLYNILKIC
jgi:hypothetical protein